MTGVDHLLAQVNIGRMLAPLDSPQLADFVAALDPVNAAADAAPGFVWRLQTEDGNATAVQAFEWDRAGMAGVLVNMSVWESVEAPAGHRPTAAEAEGRVLHLREFGPTPYAFTLREHFPPPGVANFGPTRSPEDWTCPA